tara:strand:+ start:228 stop:467 length:240 start_codon:yes stop_codon:yes gene_type:complete
MCGILFTNDPYVNKKAFLDALQKIEYRAPDTPGGYISYKSNNRLKIIDLNSRSNQPLKLQNKKYDIIFYGEIYNYDKPI